MKKTLAMILTLALVICMMPTSAFAEDANSTFTLDNVTLSPNTYTYDGTAKEPTPTVTVDGKTLVQGDAYRVTYSANTNATSDSNKPKAIITGINTYKNVSLEKEFVINKAVLGKTAVVSLDATSTTYNGSAQAPNLQVKVDNKALTMTTDYQVNWAYTEGAAEGFTAAGTYTATINAQGSNVEGTTTAIYKIEKYNVSKLTMSIDKYAGTLSNDDDLKKLNVHYKIDGAEVPAATKTFLENSIDRKFNDKKTQVIFTLKTATAANFVGAPAGGWSAPIETANDFSTVKIVKKNAGSSGAVLNDIDAGSYDAITRNVSSYFDVYDGNKKLTVDVDYSVSPGSIIDAAKTNDNNYTITVSGLNSYAGTKTLKFKLKPRDASISNTNVKVQAITDKQTNATADNLRPVVTDYVGGKTVTLTIGKDYDLSAVQNVTGKTGYKQKTLTFKGNYTGIRVVQFEVVDSQYDVNSNFTTQLGYVPSNVRYNGKTQPVSVVVRYTATSKDVPTSYYKVVYKYTDKNGKEVFVDAPKDARTYEVYVKGNNNPYAGLKKVGNYTIAQYPFSGVTFSASGSVTAATVTATASDVTGGFVKDSDFTVGVPSASGTTKATVTVRSDGTGNLSYGYKTLTYTLGNRYIYNCTITFDNNRSSSAYTGTAIKPSVVVKDTSLNNATLTKGVDYTVTYKNAAGKPVDSLRDAGTYSVIVEGKGAYSGSQTLTYTITGTDIGNYTVTLKESKVSADGRSKTPVITSVTYGYASKLNTTDYTVSYQDSTGKEVKAYQMSAPGTYRVVVTGKNGYTGSCYANFTIEGLAQSITGVESSYKIYPTSEAFKLQAKATEGVITYTSSDPSVASVDAYGYVTPHKAGRAKITISTTGNVKYNPANDATVIKVYPNKAKMTRKPWKTGNGKIKVRWNKQDNVTRYEVRYARNKSFKSGSYKTKKVNAAVNAYTTQSTTISGLSSGYTYYVKVRAVKEVYNDYGKKLTYYGNWSGWKSVRA